MPENIAIIGMNAHFGSWDGIDVFLHGLYNGHHPTLQMDPAGGWIAPVGCFDLDLASAGISPDEADHFPPAKLLMVKTAVNALLDAGYSQDADPAGNIAVMIVAGGGVPAGTCVAPAISAAFDFNGPVLDLPEADFPMWKALETAVHILASHQASTVLVGVVDLLPDPGQGTHLIEEDPKPTIRYDREMTGEFSGEGAAALVLKLEPQALKDGDRIYASIRASVALPGGSLNPDGVAEACRQACSAAMILPDQVSYLEVSATGQPSADQNEIAGTHLAYSDAQGPLACALGSVSAVIGQARAASSLASILKTALCIYHRTIPPVPGWHGPKDASLWQNSSFYVPTESRPWFIRSDPGIRYAGVNLLSADGACTHLILSGKETHEIRGNPLLENEEFRLFPVAGQTPAEILSHLDGLQRAVQENGSLTGALDGMVPQIPANPGDAPGPRPGRRAA